MRAGAGVFDCDPTMPNVTGSLHIGHMLDAYGMIDILTRWHPHARIQHLVFAGDGPCGDFDATRGGAGVGAARDRLPEAGAGRVCAARVEMEGGEWRENYAADEADLARKPAIWSREKFTLSPELSRVVRMVFVQLYEEGSWKLSRALRMNEQWCPVCLTVLSDLEVLHEDRQGHLWYVRYPVVGTQEHIVVATTRPETMLGDTAVAVHPEDGRYKHLIRTRRVYGCFATDGAGDSDYRR